MKLDDIQHETWYLLRFGPCNLSGRVDAIDAVKNRVIVWVSEMGYRSKSPVDVLRPARSPEEWVAIEKKQDDELSERWRQSHEEFDRKQSQAVERGYLPRREGVRHLQGTVFYEGDFGAR